MRRWGPFSRFPLEVGKSWESAFESEVVALSGLRRVKWHWKGRVVAAEVVAVPAGTFQTSR